jgi:hypothetical protein
VASAPGLSEVAPSQVLSRIESAVREYYSVLSRLNLGDPPFGIPLVDASAALASFQALADSHNDEPASADVSALWQDRSEMAIARPSTGLILSVCCCWIRTGI